MPVSCGWSHVGVGKRENTRDTEFMRKGLVEVPCEIEVRSSRAEHQENTAVKYIAQHTRKVAARVSAQFQKSRRSQCERSFAYHAAKSGHPPMLMLYIHAALDGGWPRLVGTLDSHLCTAGCATTTRPPTASSMVDDAPLQLHPPPSASRYLQGEQTPPAPGMRLCLHQVAAPEGLMP